ncbi:hypothetical protein [Bradyrhizobium sp. UNPA324]|uniref:hypothetical protein n=1 Tax=Bradyrhizobium sp. UNPA324 TaxID=1141174 RepID=UPI00114F5EF3|nr:hypothetical protein [Bradyrhizobium sp. UNPA324]TQF28871.1 hypothetical protein UNPA324_03825 [Bradyrhizobium sp. UNPA324]
MRDGRYDEVELERIGAAFPRAGAGDLMQVRQALETAAREYTDQSVTAELMTKAAEQRDHWNKVDQTARELHRLLMATDHGLPPVWWSPDPTHDDPAWLATARRFADETAAHARGNAVDFDAHSKANGGTRNPSREAYYGQVLAVWTDLLGGELKISKNASDIVRGPLWRFFDAAVSPVLGTSAPRPGAVADIVKREKLRRGS